MGSRKGIRRGPYKKLRSFSIEKYTCSECNKSYKRKIILLHHIRTKHLNYSAPCPVCRKYFSSPSMCNRHLKKVHKISNLNFEISLKSDIDSSKTSNFEKKIRVSDNSQFGRHIIANSEIDIGETVMKERAFASIEYVSSIRKKCFTCGDSWNLEFVKCPHCMNIWFCSRRCSKNKVHIVKCNKIFENTDCNIVRLTTEIVRVASEMVPDMRTLTDLSSSILHSKKTSSQFLPPFSKYVEMLQLKGNPKFDYIAIAKRAVVCIRELLKINSQSDEFKYYERTLFYLVYQHVVSIEVNAFSYEVPCENGVLTHLSMHDIVSRFNHSCAPNLYYITDEHNIGHCIAVRPIKQGEQLFISYLDEMNFKTTKQRQDYIKEIWDFTCKCEKCVPFIVPTTSTQSIEEDRSFKYIKKHKKDLPLRNRQRMKEECVTYLRKYGSSWTEGVDYVVDCLYLLIKTEK